MSISLALVAALTASPNDPPQLPPIVIPQVARSGDCSSAADRQAILTSLQDFVREMGPLARRANQLMAERLQTRQQRWVARGIWTAGEAQRFFTVIQRRPDYIAYRTEAAEMVGAITTDIQALTGSRDEIAICRIAQHLAGIVERAPAIGNRGWRAIEAAFADEAERRGITLD